MGAGGALGSLPGTKGTGNRQHPHFNVSLLVSPDGSQEALLTNDRHWLSSYMILTSETYSRRQPILEILTLTPQYGLWLMLVEGVVNHQ